MGLLERIRSEKGRSPQTPRTPRLTPTKRVLKASESAHEEGNRLVKKWVGEALYYDPACCEYVGSGRRDHAGIRPYPRITLLDNYLAFCAERGIVPCTVKSFVRRVLQATEELGWPPIYRDKANDSRRFVIRGVRLKDQPRWFGEDADQVPRTHNRWWSV